MIFGSATQSLSQNSLNFSLEKPSTFYYAGESLTYSLERNEFEPFRFFLTDGRGGMVGQKLVASDDARNYYNVSPDVPSGSYYFAAQSLENPVRFKSIQIDVLN